MRFPIPAWLVNAIIRHAKGKPYFDLTHADGRPYMGRWWLMPRFLLRWAPPEGDTPAHLKSLPWLPVAVRLHHIRSSDDDRHLHDHPFGYCTWILEGGYWEVIPKSINPEFIRVGDGGLHERVHYVWRAPGTFLSKRASDRHRIKVADARGAWSVFIQFRKCQPWGFYTEHGKVYWWAYSQVKDPVLAARTARAEEAVLRRRAFTTVGGLHG